MFEKEAEEYWNKDFLKWFKENTPKEGLSENTTFSKQFVYDAYVQGRVDEDNSNEWHFVKDGKYPIDEKDVEVLYQDCDKINVYNCIYDIQAENWLYYNIDNMVLELFPFIVIAWKEIVLPKEIKEND